MNPRHYSLSGAILAPLLLVMLTACATQPQPAAGEPVLPEHSNMSSTVLENIAREKSKVETQDEPGTTVEAVLPEDVLDKKDLDKDPPRYEDWHKASSDDSETKSSGTSAGAIPAVKPFNLGKDPGGPDDKTLYLTVPDLGLADVPVYNSVKDKKLKKSVVHIPAKGDEILLEDEAGNKYEYRVVEQKVVDPDNVEVMEPEDGKSLVSLQTCTLPDYKQRLIVQGELVDKST